MYYEVNQEYKYYSPLSVIFGGLKTPAIEEKTGKKDAKKPARPAAPKADVASEHPLAQEIRALGRVELALLTGQFTSDEAAGIDVLIVGDINQAKADKFIAELEKAENKELRYSVLPLDNYRYRLDIHDRFITNVMEAKKQVIINTQDLKV